MCVYNNPGVGEPGEGVRPERFGAAEGAQPTGMTTRGSPALDRVFKLAAATYRQESIDAPPCSGLSLQDPELSDTGWGMVSGGVRFQRRR